MRKRMDKKVVSRILAVGLILVCFLSVGGLAAKSSVDDESPIAADTVFDASITTENVKGIQSLSVDSISPVKTEEDLNWEAGDVSMHITGTMIRVEVPVDGEDVSFDLEMYPAVMGEDSRNRMIGIEKEEGSERYSVIRFVIEKETSYLYLLSPNMEWLGETVVNIGIQDHDTGAVYLAQFKENRFDYEDMYSKLLNGEYTDLELIDQELSYFTLRPLSELKSSYSNTDDQSGQGSSAASID